MRKSPPRASRERGHLGEGADRLPGRQGLRVPGFEHREDQVSAWFKLSFAEQLAKCANEIHYEYVPGVGYQRVAVQPTSQ